MPITALNDPAIATVSGQLKVSNDVRTGDAGNLTTDGTITAGGKVTSVNGFGGPLTGATVPTGTPPTLASNGTIALTNAPTIRISNAGACTGVILSVSGVSNGQIITVYNEGTGSITFAAVGTSNVGSGTSCVIDAGSAMLFQYNDKAATPAWYSLSGK